MGRWGDWLWWRAGDRLGLDFHWLRWFRGRHWSFNWRLRDDRRGGRGWRRWRFGNWLRWFGFRFRFDWFRLYDGGRFLGHFGFRLRRRRDFGRDWSLLDPLCFHMVTVLQVV